MAEAQAQPQFSDQVLAFLLGLGKNVARQFTGADGLGGEAGWAGKMLLSPFAAAGATNPIAAGINKGVGLGYNKLVDLLKERYPGGDASVDPWFGDAESGGMFEGGHFRPGGQNGTSYMPELPVETGVRLDFNEPAKGGGMFGGIPAPQIAPKAPPSWVPGAMTAQQGDAWMDAWSRSMGTAEDPFNVRSIAASPGDAVASAIDDRLGDRMAGADEKWASFLAATGRDPSTPMSPPKAQPAPSSPEGRYYTEGNTVELLRMPDGTSIPVISGPKYTGPSGWTTASPDTSFFGVDQTPSAPSGETPAAPQDDVWQEFLKWMRESGQRLGGGGGGAGGMRRRTPGPSLPPGYFARR